MGRSSRKVEIVFDLENESEGSVVSCPAKVNTHKINIKSSPSKRPKKAKSPLLGEEDEEHRSVETGQVLSPRSYKRMVMVAGVVHIAFVAAHFLLNNNSRHDESPLLRTLLRTAGAGADAYYDGDNSQSYGLEPVGGDDGVLEYGDAAESTDMFLALKREGEDEYQVLLSSPENATII
jgi:hypothetical protein